MRAPFHEVVRPDMARVLRPQPDGEQIVLERNPFIERVLPGFILRTHGDAEMDEYRRPFPAPADRRPMLASPRQLPVGVDPALVVDPT